MDLSQAIDRFIAEAHDNPIQIAKLAARHRVSRNNHYEEVILSSDFPGIQIDEILTARLNNPDYLDPRNNMCLFAWPSKDLVDLISIIQKDLQIIAPNIWLSPPEWLHMTVIELAHSKSPAELSVIAETVKPHASKLTSFAKNHPVGLNRPMLSLDDTAVALTFLPAEDSRYTYLHLRRDLANICAENGVEVASKYYNTSSHITFARFANTSNLRSRESLEAWVRKIKSINQWLMDVYWPKDGQGALSPGLRWTIGTGSGVAIRKGRLWYGDGIPVDSGEAGEP